MNKAKLLNDFSQLLDDLKNLQDHDDLYTFEQNFVSIYGEFGRKLFEQHLGKKTSNRRKKKGLK